MDLIFILFIIILVGISRMFAITLKPTLTLALMGWENKKASLKLISEAFLIRLWRMAATYSPSVMRVSAFGGGTYTPEAYRNGKKL